MKKIEMLKNKIKSVRENTGEEGFSLIELVVAVGILAILSVVGLIAYSGITDNARQTAIEAAASDVLTGAVAYESDADVNTDAELAADSYNASTDKINVTAVKNADGSITVTATEVGRDADDTKSVERTNAVPDTTPAG